MTELHLDAKIICTNGECGKSKAVIVNPVNREVTHLVVTYSYGEYMVPLSFVTASDHDHIRLSCSAEELTQMPSFTKVQVVGDPDADFLMYDEWSAPYVTSYPMEEALVETELVPPGELAVHRGDPVSATDGHVGEVGEFVVDAESGHISHLVLQKGHLWGKREVTLPIGLIDRVEEGVVYLNVDKAAINELPAVKIKRHYPWQKDD
jgi:sporulation protein YlmC with PRC-barrel domain